LHHALSGRIALGVHSHVRNLLSRPGFDKARDYTSRLRAPAVSLFGNT
jgi:hypothetical protein